MTFRIDRAAIADIPAMHAIRLAVRENRLTNPALVTEQSYVRYIEDGSTWVALRPDRILVGFAALDRSDASVWALFVHPDEEGAGIGMALHDALLDEARRLGIGVLRLVTAPGTRAERFYRRAGWAMIGRSESGEVRLRRSVISARLGA